MVADLRLHGLANYSIYVWKKVLSVNIQTDDDNNGDGQRLVLIGEYLYPKAPLLLNWTVIS